LQGMCLHIAHGVSPEVRVVVADATSVGVR